MANDFQTLFTSITFSSSLVSGLFPNKYTKEFFDKMENRRDTMKSRRVGVDEKPIDESSLIVQHSSKRKPVK